MSGLRVGAARVCIDPPTEMYPFQSTFGICDQVRDPCHVRALALDNGQRRILFVVYELSDMPTDPDILASLSDASGVPEGDIILAVTHNHTSPSDMCKFPCEQAKLTYFRYHLVRKGAEAARKAVEALRPARYGYGTVNSFCNVNRDMRTRFGFWVEGPNHRGYSDKTLSVLKFTDEEGRLIAALMNYGAHAVCAFMHRDTDGKVKTSCNFPGLACRFVEDTYGGDAVALWTSGCAGNQDPALWDYEILEYPDGYVTKLRYPDGTGYINMDVLGARQGADAVTCLESIDASRREMDIRYLKAKVPIPARRRDPGFRSPSLGVRMGGDGPRTDWSAPKLPDLPVMLPDPDRDLRFELDFLKLGDVGVILTSGELYAEIGRDLMEAVPMDNTFVITHIPGEGGYTLDRGSVDHRTFQAFGPVEPGGADIPLTEKIRELAGEALREDR